LIVGELVPKQIALRNPEGLAVRVAPAMTWLARVGAPLVSLLDVSGALLLRVLGYTPESERKVTEEEVRILIAEAETAGVIEPGERAMISGVLRLGDRPVRAVMTPRHEVDAIDLAESRAEVRARIVASRHSRFPVYRGEPEEIIGIVHAKDLLNAFICGEDPDISTCVQPAPVVPDTADALDVIALIKRSPAHMALIHDEYGHFEGLVTSADVVEAIIGAPATPDEAEEPDAVQRQDGSWLIAGSMAADALAELLAIDLPRDGSYHTAAGYVLSKLGHLPDVGECFEASGWRFEIVDLDGRRIDKLLATRVGRRREAARG
jgi:putative hemolysin